MNQNPPISSVLPIASLHLQSRPPHRSPMKMSSPEDFLISCSTCISKPCPWTRDGGHFIPPLLLLVRCHAPTPQISISNPIQISSKNRNSNQNNISIHAGEMNTNPWTRDDRCLSTFCSSASATHPLHCNIESILHNSMGNRRNAKENPIPSLLRFSSLRLQPRPSH